MAVKAVAEIVFIRVAPSGTWQFNLAIHEMAEPFRYADFVEVSTVLPASTSTLAQIQSAIATFTKTWTTDNWGTVWVPVTDSLRVLNPSVTNVNA